MPKASPGDGGINVGCDKFGRFIDRVFPPNSQYIFLISEQCEQKDAKPIALKCENCGKENQRYWDRYHTFVAAL
jgi:hypothetical protein